MRNILGTEPRVTRFKINWDDSETQEQTNQQGDEQISEGVSFTESSGGQNAMEVV